MPNVGVKLKEDTPVTIVSLENEVSVKKFGKKARCIFAMMQDLNNYFNEITVHYIHTNTNKSFS